MCARACSECQNPRSYLEALICVSPHLYTLVEALGDDQNEGLHIPRPEVPSLFGGEEQLFVTPSSEFLGQHRMWVLPDQPVPAAYLGDTALPSSGSCLCSTVPMKSAASCLLPELPFCCS